MPFFDLKLILDVIAVMGYPVPQLNAGIAHHTLGRNHSSSASRISFFSAAQLASEKSHLNHTTGKNISEVAAASHWR